VLKKHNNKWRVDIRIHGQRIRKNFSSRHLAEIYHARIEQQKIELLYPNIMPHHITLSSFVKKILEHIDKNHCRNTYLSYRLCLNAFMDYYRGADPYLHTISTIEVNGFLESLPTISNRTWNERVKVIKATFNKALTWGYLPTIPTQNIKTRPTTSRAPTWIDKKKINILLGIAPSHLKLIMLIAYLTGMRRSEILNLKWCDIDFERKTISVKSGKTKKIRIIPIHSYLVSVFKKNIKGRNKGGYVCLFNGKRIQNNFYSALGTLKQKTGIRFNFHDLRHSFALNALYAGVPISVVRDILGHSNIKTTSRYLSYTDSQSHQIDKLPI